MTLERTLLALAGLQLLTSLILVWRQMLLKDRILWLENRQVVTDVKEVDAGVEVTTSILKDAYRA